MIKKITTSSLIILMIIALALAATGCGSSGAGDVINTFFESVDKHDAKKFISCFDEDIQEDIKAMYEDNDIIKELLENLDTMLSDEYGEKWRKEIKIGKAEKGDTEDGVTYYTVPVEMDGEEEEIQVMKIKGKYYLDDSAMMGLGF